MMIFRKNDLVLRSADNLVYRCNDCPCGGYYIGFFCSSRVNGTDRNYLGEYVYDKETGTMNVKNYPVPDNPFTGSDGTLYIVPADRAYYGEASGHYLMLFDCHPDYGPSIPGVSSVVRILHKFASESSARQYMQQHEDILKSLAASECRICSFRFWQDYVTVVGDDPGQNANTIDITLHGQTFTLYFSGFTNNGSTEQTADDLLNASVWTDYQFSDNYGYEYLPEDGERKSYAAAMGSSAGCQSFAELEQIAYYTSPPTAYWNEDATPIIPEGASLASWGVVSIRLSISMHIGAQRSDFVGYTEFIDHPEYDRILRNYFHNVLQIKLEYEYPYTVPDESGMFPFIEKTIHFETYKTIRFITKNSLLLTYPQGKKNAAVAGIAGPWGVGTAWDPAIPESKSDAYYEWYNSLQSEPTWKQLHGQVSKPDWIIALAAFNTADRITMIYYRDAAEGASSVSCDDAEEVPTDGVDTYTIDRLYWKPRITAGEDCNGGTQVDYYTDEELPEEFE